MPARARETSVARLRDAHGSGAIVVDGSPRLEGVNVTSVYAGPSRVCKRKSRSACHVRYPQHSPRMAPGPRRRGRTDALLHDRVSRSGPTVARLTRDRPRSCSSIHRCRPRAGPRARAATIPRTPTGRRTRRACSSRAPTARRPACAPRRRCGTCRRCRRSPSTSSTPTATTATTRAPRAGTRGTGAPARCTSRRRCRCCRRSRWPIATRPPSSRAFAARPKPRALARAFGAARARRRRHGVPRDPARASRCSSRIPPEFYPYDSKYDACLRGQADAHAARSRAGLALFNDPAKGNCAVVPLERAEARRVPGVHRLGLHRARRAAQSRHRGNATRALRPGPVRAAAHRPRGAPGILRAVPHAVAAQRPRGAGVLPQRRVHARLEDAVRFYAERDTNARALVPAMRDGASRRVRRPAARLSRQREPRAAVRRQARRQARARCAARSATSSRSCRPSTTATGLAACPRRDRRQPKNSRMRKSSRPSLSSGRAESTTTRPRRCDSQRKSSCVVRADQLDHALHDRALDVAAEARVHLDHLAPLPVPVGLASR